MMKNLLAQASYWHWCADELERRLKNNELKAAENLITMASGNIDIAKLLLTELQKSTSDDSGDVHESSLKSHIVHELARRIEEDKPTGEMLVFYIELALANWFEFKAKDGKPSDSEILDFLDKLNRDQNSRYNSNYGWQIDVNHNRVSLNDMGMPGRDVRTAIVDSMSSLVIDKDVG